MNADPVHKELFHVAGDAPDPSGRSARRGVAPTYDLTQTAAGHPMLFYRLPNGRELVLEADVYQLEDQPIYVHIVCPLCAMCGRSNGLTIRQGLKQVSYEPGEPVPLPPGWSAEQLRQAFPLGLGGRLNTETVECAWEADPELRKDAGFVTCPWRVVIENNVVREV
jgi:hypothetical protein